jgi:hypothetical protein
VPVPKLFEQIQRVDLLMGRGLWEIIEESMIRVLRHSDEGESNSDEKKQHKKKFQSRTMRRILMRDCWEQVRLRERKRDLAISGKGQSGDAMGGWYWTAFRVTTCRVITNRPL